MKLKHKIVVFIAFCIVTVVLGILTEVSLLRRMLIISVVLNLWLLVEIGNLKTFLQYAIESRIAKATLIKDLKKRIMEVRNG